MTLTGTAGITGVITAVVATVGVVVITGVMTVVNTAARVVTGDDTKVVVTGSWGTAFRGMSLIMVTTGVAVKVTGGRGVGSGIDLDTNHSSSCPKYLDSLLLQFTTTKCVLYT